MVRSIRHVVPIIISTSQPVSCPLDTSLNNCILLHVVTVTLYLRCSNASTLSLTYCVLPYRVCALLKLVIFWYEVHVHSTTYSDSPIVYQLSSYTQTLPLYYLSTLYYPILDAHLHFTLFTLYTDLTVTVFVYVYLGRHLRHLCIQSSNRRT